MHRVDVNKRDGGRTLNFFAFSCFSCYISSFSHYYLSLSSCFVSSLSLPLFFVSTFPFSPCACQLRRHCVLPHQLSGAGRPTPSQYIISRSFRSTSRAILTDGKRSTQTTFVAPYHTRHGRDSSDPCSLLVFPPTTLDRIGGPPGLLHTGTYSSTSMSMERGNWQIVIESKQFIFISEGESITPSPAPSCTKLLHPCYY